VRPDYDDAICRPRCVTFWRSIQQGHGFLETSITVSVPPAAGQRSRRDLPLTPPSLPHTHTHTCTGIDPATREKIDDIARLQIER
jgi:hypothetical protein